MVFCRNLLIYLDAPARAAAFASIGRLLADGGLLFLGHADRPDDSPASPFTPLAGEGELRLSEGSAGRRQGRPRPTGGGKPPRKPAAIRPAECRRPRETPRPGPSPEGGGAGAGRPARPGESPSPRLAALEEAARLADAGRYDEASRRVERAIAESGATPGRSSCSG